METETFQVLFSNPMQVLNKMTRKDYNDLVEKLNRMTISITVGYKNGDVKTYDVPLVIEDLKI